MTVSRATFPERFEIYTSTLAKRLPRFKVPLAADDRDAVVDLQAAFNRAYDACAFGGRIDYARDPGLPWDDETRSRGRVAEPQCTGPRRRKALAKRMSPSRRGR